jgi:hypothetical protein
MVHMHNCIQSDISDLVCILETEHKLSVSEKF